MVAIIATVFNEEESIEIFLNALLRQTLKPDEIIIVDGGSADGTLTVLKKWQKITKNLKIYSHPGNRSVGRNYAINHCKSNIIAITDAGCVAHPDWLLEITTPFKNPDVQVVSGYYQGHYKNIFQKSLLPYVLVMPDKAGRSEFFPSTRSMAIRKNIFTKSGGFNEDLWHNEDFEYAYKLKSLGVNFTFAPRAIVEWLPRKNLRQSAWMFLRFAVGDAQAGILRPKVKFLIFRYIVFIYLFFLSLDITFIQPLLVVLIILYLVWAIIKNYKYVRHPAAVLWLPTLQLTSDICVIFGTLVGFLYKIAAR